MDEFAVMALLNGAIATAYFVMAWYLSPRLGLPPLARAAAVAFFTFGGLTHTELIVHGLGARPEWIVSSRMFAIQAIQVVVDWAFIVGAVRYLDIAFTHKRSASLKRMVEAEHLSQLGSWEWDLRRDRFDGSEQLFRVTGVHRRAAMTAREVLVGAAHPDDQPLVSQRLETARGQGGIHDFEYRIQVRGRDRWLQVRMESERGRGGRPSRIFGIAQDVTERRSAELARAELNLTQEAYQREHGIAETLQRSLLPDRLPEIAGLELAATYLPGGRGTEVGGDWYDVIPLPGGAVGIAMGDVVGRGIPAASLVGKLRNGLRAYALEGHPPGEVLRRLNALVSDTRREMSTAIFVEYRPGTGELRGANAGHPPALVRRAGGGIERWDAARSMPLGVVGHARYEDEAIRLEPGDAVLLFTDGLIERRGLPIGDALDRLERAVPPSGSADELRTAVLDRTLGGEDHDDDVAVLAIAVPVDVPEEVELELPAVPGSLASMRRAIDLWMNGTDVPPEIRERAMLALGEAAGNAVEHAYGPAPASFAVAARTVGASMEIVVSDSGSWRPPRGSGRGRGLRIIEAVSDSVDVERGADGTIVRLTYALPEDER